MTIGLLTASYITSSVLFILALGGLSNQEKAKRAVWYGIVGMAIAVFATILRLYDFPMPPLILAFVLGGLMEENLRRSLLISDGSWSFLWDRPLTLIIMLIILTIVGWQIFRSFSRKN